jgi:uncharacterized delta-60 repeat protein
MLDPTFGVGGQVTTRFPIPSVDVGRATAVDSHDRIVVAGHAINGPNSNFVVIRFTPSGALDTTFGGTGIVTIAFGQDGSYGLDVAIDSMDRVVVAGYTFPTTVSADFAVARLTASGTLDTSFDGDGKQTVAFGTGDDRAYGGRRLTGSHRSGRPNVQWIE